MYFLLDCSITKKANFTQSARMSIFFSQDFFIKYYLW